VAINKSKLARLGTNKSDFPDEVRNDWQRTSLAMDLNKAAKTSKSSFVLSDAKYLDDAAGAMAYFEKQGILQTQVDGIPSTENPYEHSYACFKERTGTRATTIRDLKTVSKNYVQNLRSHRDVDGRQAFGIRARVENIAGKYPECTDLGSATQMGEMSSDVWGARALGKWLENHPPITTEEKMAPLASFFVSFCALKKRAGSTDSAKLNLDSILTAHGKVSAARHPASRIRADKIYLSDPRIQKALGCRPVEDSACFDKSFKSKATPVQTVEAQPTGSTK
jgi:hypothetical protein